MDGDGNRFRERIDAVPDAHADHDSLLMVAITSPDDPGRADERVERDRTAVECPDTDAERAVQETLDRAHEQLRSVDVPDHEIILYVGVDAAGDVVEQVFDDLPASVGKFVYARNDEFDLTSLDAAAESDVVYGLFVVSLGGGELEWVGPPSE